MRSSRTLAALGGLALTATTVVGIAPTSSAVPLVRTAGSATGPDGPLGRGVEPSTTAAPGATSRAAAASAAAAAPITAAPLTMPSSYPAQPSLRVYPQPAYDAADAPGLVGHADIAPALNDLMSRSNRVSAQVVGQSTNGRDLYLVTLTSPETAAQTAAQTAWRNEIKNNPATAATDPALAAAYKKPLWISANIHGNEWEGTDAALQYLTELATSTDPAVKALLDTHRIYFSPSLNPDGRTAGTRQTRLALDPNRDMITNKTPEATSFVRTAQAVQPIYAADFHGYTGVLQVEPCGPPHGENYEYDLSIPHNYAMALKVEQDVVNADIAGNTYYDQATGRATATKTGKIKIPYRDTPSGWDDYPPIFTAQYAAFYGAATSTVELPLGRISESVQSADSARVNVAVAKQTMSSMATYFAANSGDMLGDQIEQFRRGVAGAPKTALTVAGVAAVPGPAEWKPLWDVADNQDPVSVPRAYVVPVGTTQRSASDASALVAQLLFHGISVSTLDAPVTVGTTTYPRGSYVVDMHQPLRNLANALLDKGSDISAKVPTMYDVSAWSYSYLWGATVAKVGSTTDAPLGATTPVSAVPAPAAAARGWTTFEVAGLADYRVLNEVLEDGVSATMLADGSVVVPPAGYDAVSAAARSEGVALTTASAADIDQVDDADAKPLQDLTIAYSGTQDDTLALTELGFDDLVPVSDAQLLNDSRLLDDVDVLWVNATVATSGRARATIQEFVDDGGSIVGAGAAGFSTASGAGLVSGTVRSARGDANAIVSVINRAGSPLAPYAQDSAFTYPASWFTALGASTRVEQTYGAGNPVLAGHWLATAPTTATPNPEPNGPTVAAGQASVVSGRVASGAKALIFGTSVFFRTHTKGSMSQVGRALFWSSAPAAVVTPTTPGATPAPAPGTAPAAPTTAAAAAAAAKAVSVTRLKLRSRPGGRAKLVVSLSSAGSARVGTVRITEKGGKVTTVRVRAKDDGRRVAVVGLGRGRHVLTATYDGNLLVAGSSDRASIRLP